MSKYLMTGIVAAIGLFAGLLYHDWPSVAIARDWQAPTKAAKIANPVAMDQSSIQRGQKAYRKYCLMCHGPAARGDGLAASSLDPKPANLVERITHRNDGDFFWKIMNGRLPMPGFKDQLSDQQIWDSINFIKSLEK